MNSRSEIPIQNLSVELDFEKTDSGRFFIIEVTDEKIVLGNRACPFAEKVLRAKSETADSVLVAVTGYGQAHDKHKTKAVGFDYHLVKPADINEIEKILTAIA